MEQWFEDVVLAIVAPGVGLLVTILNSLIGTVPWSYVGVMWAVIVGIDSVIAVNKLRARL